METLVKPMQTIEGEGGGDQSPPLVRLSTRGVHPNPTCTNIQHAYINSPNQVIWHTIRISKRPQGGILGDPGTQKGITRSKTVCESCAKPVLCRLAPTVSYGKMPPPADGILRQLAATCKVLAASCGNLRQLTAVFGSKSAARQLAATCGNLPCRPPRHLAATCRDLLSGKVGCLR